MYTSMKNKKTSEAEFAELFLAQLHDLAIFKSYPVVFQEMITGTNGVPDAVLLSKKDQEVLLSFANKFPNLELTNAHAIVINKLYAKRFTKFESLLIKSGLSAPYLKKVLADLMRMDVIVSAETTKSFRLRSDFYLPYLELMSIEFKLDNWKSALRQALRYRAFSDKSFVVMPASKKKLLSQNADLFKKFGIGLALYDHVSGDIEILVKPKRTNVNALPSYTDTLGRILARSSELVIA